MGWKYSLYGGLPVIVFLVLGVPAAIVYSGNAEPYVAAADMPVHAGFGFVGLVLSVFATAIVSGVLVNRSFVRTCRSLGLSKQGGGLLGGPPDFTGSIGGRPVSVETRKVRRSTGGQGGTSSTTYTRVHAELDRPLEDGFILIEADADDPSATEDVPEDVEQVPVGEGFSVVGAANESPAAAVLTPRVQEVLGERVAGDGVVVGDPASAIVDTLPDEMAAAGSILTGGEGIEEKLREEIGDDAATVSHEFQGLPLDADRLESRIDAMITLAEAVDEAAVADDRAEGSA